jgi:hypothetical protein
VRRQGVHGRHLGTALAPAHTLEQPSPRGRLEQLVGLEARADERAAGNVEEALGERGQAG